MTMTDSRLQRRAAPAIPKAVVSDQFLQAWLIVVAALVFAIIFVGGATRLTDSGLSITEWLPILGALPPLSAADWQEAFAKYKAIPQYESVNKGMTLEAFKVIFWWEWGHRLLGRVIGLAAAVPLVFLWLTGRLRSDYALPLLGLAVLIGVQGAVGWYMVQSGLVGRIDVSQYRLALHLSIAFVILGYLVWLILSLAPQRQWPALQTLSTGRRWAAYALAGLVFSQVAIGGFVAGLKAGRAYNTWPLMDGQIIPDGLWRLSPTWLNFTENMTMVQFNHRLTAYVLVAFALWHAVRIVREADDERVRWSAIAVAVGVVAQMALGIWTVVAAVPFELGVGHQIFAAVVFACAVWHAHAVYVSTGMPVARAVRSGRA
jgi:heme a synthase